MLEWKSQDSFDPTVRRLADKFECWFGKLSTVCVWLNNASGPLSLRKSGAYFIQEPRLHCFLDKFGAMIVLKVCCADTKVGGQCDLGIGHLEDVPSSRLPTYFQTFQSG